MVKENEKNTAERPPVESDEDSTAAASTAEVPPVTTEYVNPDDKVERDSVDEDKSSL